MEHLTPDAYRHQVISKLVDHYGIALANLAGIEKMEPYITKMYLDGQSVQDTADHIIKRIETLPQ